jgi:cardiolipin synthase
MMPHDWFANHPLWLTTFVACEWTVRIVMLVVVPFRRSPDAAKGWLLLIFFEPALGLMLYLLIGRPRLPDVRAARSTQFVEHAEPTLNRLARSPAIYHPETDPSFAPAVRLANALGEMPILGGNAVEVVTDYETIFARLVADIDAATSHVHLLFYIFADDAWSARIVAALARAEARGVECRILADCLGSRPHFERMLPRLRAAGIEATETLPVGFFRRHTARIDLRNHRKIAVVDGRIGWTGSLNIVDPTFKPGLTYEELMVRVTGPVVLELQAVFAGDWYLETGLLVADAEAFPEPAITGDVAAQVLPSSPAFPHENAQQLIVALIHAARHRVVITTPYFVPDAALLQAMTSAVLRGVDVRLVVPAQDDQILVCMAQKSYYAELLRAGVRICRYGVRFLHAKHATFDDAAAWIGSSNMDIRSFALNAEVTLLCYDPRVCAKLAAEQERYFRDGAWIDPIAWDRTALPRQVAWNLARLLSPLL